MSKQSLDRFLRDLIERRIKKALKEFKKITEILVAISKISDEITEMKKSIKVLKDVVNILMERTNVNDIRIDKIEKYGATPDTHDKKGIPHVTGKDIFEFRKKNHLSLKNFAALFGGQQACVSKWERGLASIHPNAEKEIKRILEMDQDDLVKEFQKKDIFIPYGHAPKKKSSSREKRPKIITSSQIRALRLTLGLSQKRIAAMYKTNESTWCNWEYGRTPPPPDIAKSLLEKHKETFGVVMNKHGETIDSSSGFSFLEMLSERMKSVGMSRRALAQMMGVCTSTIDNWVNQKTTPSDENIEKLIGILGAVHTKSAKDAARKRKESKQKRKMLSSDYQHPAQQLRDFRKEHNLSRKEMCIIMWVPYYRYCNWEKKNRGLPPEYNSSFRALLMVDHEDIVRQLKYWSNRSKQQ